MSVSKKPETKDGINTIRGFGNGGRLTGKRGNNSNKIAKANATTFAHRQESSSLRECMRKKRRNPTSKCYFEGNRLFINNTAHTLEELERKGEISHQKPSRAPST
ncbi:hypothetical protein JTB14_000185 [Gonioctena quinquepunctata]|nr:hypothetical protein JTB14_000185 [Gonioctena quinquepunctata]